MKKRTLAMILTGAMALGMLAGCSGGNSGNDSSADSGSSNGSKGKIGVFIAQNGNEFTMTVGNSAKEKGESLGYEVSVFDGKADQDTQVGQIENCITQGYAGLIVEPVSNDGLNTVFHDAISEGIPVVTVVQTCAVQDEITAFVGADYEEASYVEATAWRRSAAKARYVSSRARWALRARWSARQALTVPSRKIQMWKCSKHRQPTGKLIRACR